jgi:hypothetical protein
MKCKILGSVLEPEYHALTAECTTMGLFRSLFGKPRAISVAATAEALDYSISNLRIGLLKHLLRIYSPAHGEEAKLLSGAIINYALVEQPTHDAGKRYLAENHKKILREFERLRLRGEISTALSYLYAAQILYLQMSLLSGNKLAAAKIPELSNRAGELLVEIPDTYEICGKGDAYSCAEALALFARDFNR